MKFLSRNHEMAVIVSIHQPNSELINMFDNIYVLAKGGVSVYSDPPQDMILSLTECRLNCNEFDAPIEVLLKVSSMGLIELMN